MEIMAPKLNKLFSVFKRKTSFLKLAQSTRVPGKLSGL